MRLHLVPFLVIVGACQTLSQAEQSTPPTRPDVPSVLDTPVEFVGPRGPTAPFASFDEIRIGLFAPTDTGHAVGSAMLQGAKLAVEQFNTAGGFDGVPLRLKQRWNDDPWRGGSKEMIKLVYEDSVWAVIGSVDGAATHIAEQVVTKAWAPLVSPVSADPTLTYIRIPWMFRLPPDEKRQAAALIRDGIRANSLSDVGLITSADHDGRLFGEEMRKQMAGAYVPPVFHLQVSARNLDLDAIVRHLSSFDPSAVVVRLPEQELLALLEALESAGFDSPVLTPWVPGLVPSHLEGRYAGSLSFVIPFSTAGSRTYAAFQRHFRDRFGVAPTPSAAYTFDAVNLLIRSLLVAAERAAEGVNRAALRDAVADASGYVGVTGPVVWDNAGGNQAEPTLVKLEGRDSNNQQP
jgi:ABC-type branched-subunit amino acid transport system substrate-binding protein